jgi:hypothetical protein
MGTGMFVYFGFLRKEPFANVRTQKNISTLAGLIFVKL